MAEDDKTPKPATSVHLNYQLPPWKPKQGSISRVVFHNEVTVTQSHNQTYFAAIQFHHPVGYCGIQQRNSEHDKIAIFSVWNSEQHKVKLKVAGHGVTVQPFGGEGEGLKSTCPLSWSLLEKVAFTVTVEENSPCVFIIRCDVHFRGKDLHMATYSLCDENEKKYHFVSFVEDWNRSPGAKGMSWRREGHFSGAYFEANGSYQTLTKATFSKVMHGSDKYGCDRCSAHTENGKFVLHTGNKVCLEECCPYGQLLTL